MREAWPYASMHNFLLFDRDSKFGAEVVSAVRELGSAPVRTSFRSPWQNGVAERWVGSCRRELLDHVIVLNERHLKRLMAEYVRFDHEDRTHLGLAKDTPAGRLGAPQVGFSSAMRTIKARISWLTRILPPTRRARDSHLQYSRTPARCHPTTVLGVTSMSDCFHADQYLSRTIQKNLCMVDSRRRGRFRLQS